MNCEEPCSGFGVHRLLILLRFVSLFPINIIHWLNLTLRFLLPATVLSACGSSGLVGNNHIPECRVSHLSSPPRPISFSSL